MEEKARRFIVVTVAFILAGLLTVWASIAVYVLWAEWTHW